MKKLWVIVLLLAAGCNKKHSPVSLGVTEPERVYYVAMGQSNIYNMGTALESRFIAESGNTALLVVNIAVPGSYLSYWQPGAEGYQKAVDTIRSMNSQGYKLKGVLFWQGEAEALDGQYIEDWAYRFTIAIRELRRSAASQFPVSMVKISPNYLGRARWDEVRQQQDMVNFDGLAKITCDDLTIGPDKLHFEATERDIIAHRLYTSASDE